MLIIGLFAHLQHCLVRYKSRKALEQLTAQQISDIGMTQCQRKKEVSKATWFGFIREFLDYVQQKGH